MKKAIVFGVFIFVILLSYIFIAKPASAQTTPSCGSIKTTDGTALDNLLSGRSYTLTAENCQNTATYQWSINKISCPGTFSSLSGSASTIQLNTPQLLHSGQVCRLEASLRVCNSAGQCSNLPSYSQVSVKYALPLDAKQWTFNVSLSCQNGATPINVNVNTIWNFLGSNGSSTCQPNAGESRGSTQTALTFSETFSSAPSQCSRGIYNISKIAEGESATFKDASSSLITTTENDPGTASWSIANLPTGNYTLNYYLPSSSCPTITTTPRPSPCNGVGDINNDGLITVEDSGLLARYLAKLETFTDDQKRRADANGDGTIELDDNVEIGKFTAGIINTFAACTTPPQTCTLKPQGDANCDGAINISDFLIWKTEFLNYSNINGPTPPTPQADFNNDQIVNIQDFLIWKTGFLNPNVAH